MLHAALMVPLQDRTARLQQANTTLASRMHTLLALTRDVRKQVEQIDARAQDTLAHLRAAAACRSHMQQQIQHAQLAVDRLQLDAHAETLKIARLQYELRQLHARRDGAQHDIQQSRSDAAAAQRARAQELKTHECQGQRLQASADESAVRCEVVALMAHRSCVRELLQTQALDALLALCRRSPAVRAKLVANGLQSLVLETLQRFRASERVAMSGCALVVLLTQSACCDSNAAPAESPAPTLRISGHLAAWPTRVLVSVLTSVTLGFADSLSFEAICQTTHVALQSLRDAPQLSDVDETELRRLVRDAHATIVHHASFTRLDGNPALQRALQHAAR